MSEDIKKYFTTGEFARLCNVKKKPCFIMTRLACYLPK